LVLASELQDPATREPRWAARPVDDQTLIVVYLLSYHLDYGSTHAACDFEPGTYWCRGHPGDSEVIALTIRYIPETQHWLLVQAQYSSHESYKVYASAGTYPRKLEYPETAGGRPRSYVATGKHANAATFNECNAGGFLGIDSCSIGRYEVVVTGADKNIGSQSVRLHDCVGSTHPVFAPLGYSECYWSREVFHGWTGAVGFPEPTGGYPQRLRRFGFLID
jgi:hypothetical protein